MAQPSSSHRERERDTDREHRHRSSSHHHHRTISSTTLLLVLSLVLAVLAVMLSLPSSSSTGVPGEATPSGVWNLLTPKRSQQLIQREAGIAIREAEVARREAELLVGAPGGVVPSPPSCPACTATAIVTTSTVTVSAPAQTVIKEVITENALTPPGWTGQDRIGEIVDRELKIVERERDIGAREASVNRREHDAARREAWIMEQLNSLGDDRIPVAEEIVYEQPKMRQPKLQELPSIIVSETQYETETRTVVQTQFVTVPQPASTRPVAKPAPEGVRSSSTVASPRTTAIEIITEEDDPSYTIAASRPRTTHRPPQRWFGA